MANTPARFEALLKDLKARGLDTVLFTNNFVASHAPLLEISDRLGVGVIFAPMVDLHADWWPEPVPADLETARDVIRPLVDRLAGHPSLKGYNIVDEPHAHLRDKIALAVQVFKELDPARPAMPTLAGLDRGDVIFDAARPDVMLIDVYPAAQSNALCDFTMSGFGYPDLDFVGYVRAMTRNKPANVPLWFILQTHSWDRGPGRLRAPTPTEVRLQNWLAIGEGAKGIFWFIFSSQQGWRGLSDNPAVYAEVTDLAGRIAPLRPLLLGLRRGPDRFVVSGTATYVSTLMSADESRWYAVVANRDCERTRRVSIRSPNLRGSLRDLESGRIYSPGDLIRLGPGDGRILELLPQHGLLPNRLSGADSPGIAQDGSGV
jgi:hypothetical protein